MSYEPASAAGLRHELEQAEANLNHFLELQKTSSEEVARWQGIVTQLQETIEMIEKPAKAIQKLPSVSRGAPGKSRIRWAKQWPIVLGELQSKNVTPTKRQLMDIVQSRYRVSEAYANAIVNGAINRGDLELLLDRCYLPGTSPATQRPRVA